MFKHTVRLLGIIQKPLTVYFKCKKIRIKYIKDIKFDKILTGYNNKSSNKNKQNYFSSFFEKHLCKNDSNRLLGLKILTNILYVPASELALKRNTLYLSESIELEQGSLTPEILFSNSRDLLFKVSEKLQYATISKKYYNQKNKEQKGINLLHSINNYWHFCMEQAPKILIAQRLQIPCTVPLLVPDNLHPNLYQIIDILNQGRFKRKLIKITTDLNIPETIKIKNSYHISDHLNIQTHYRKEKIITPDLFKKQQLNINPYPIRDFVKTIFNYYKITPSPNKNIKLFLKRESGFRIAKDQEKLEKFLLEKGFTSFNPTNLTLEEQVRICSQASIFIGFSGAGFTNSIFLPELSKKVLFANRTFLHLVSFWNVLLNNLHVLDNGFKETTFDKIHGKPYLTKRNWKDLETILENI
ncbi:MAG: glycosyltransferase family 61 protein [Alphaproteobacteria bacterium]|nr:glycosyltransferase family 61 protein [Alphaproteobacteria bacterium]